MDEIETFLRQLSELQEQQGKQQLEAQRDEVRAEQRKRLGLGPAPVFTHRAGSDNPGSWIKQLSEESR